MGAGAICTHFGGGIEFVSDVAGGTGMGAVGGASGAVVAAPPVQMQLQFVVEEAILPR